MSDPIKCVAHGVNRECLREKINPATGVVIERHYSSVRLFWWWDRNLQFGAIVVSDGEPEPEFEFDRDIDFEVTEFSNTHIETQRAR